jgi:hypothetical protein
MTPASERKEKRKPSPNGTTCEVSVKADPKDFT